MDEINQKIALFIDAPPAGKIENVLSGVAKYPSARPMVIGNHPHGEQERATVRTRDQASAAV